MNTSDFDFGMIGLGVMGRNLLLNMADHGYRVIGYDKDPEKGKALEASGAAHGAVRGVTNLGDMISSLAPPRRIMMLVPAGKPVDDVLASLRPLVAPGDIIIDGGNSHYTDTLRRVKALQGSGLHFVGIGISGGEHGARTGPSIMPGGDAGAWEVLKPILESVAAKVNGQPCVGYLGKDAAGHYVKMVHNGIEYSIMQMIGECYDLLHRGAGAENDELHKIFSNWNEGELQSYLVEITANIFLQPDEMAGGQLVDSILDQAGSKGTGKWTSQDALDLGVPVPSIDMAVIMRGISAIKDQRVRAETLYQKRVPTLDVPVPVLANELHDALYCGMLISYAQGMALLHEASDALRMDIPFREVINVWRGGCIIRSQMLRHFSAAYESRPGLENLLLDEGIAAQVRNKEANLRKVIAMASMAGYPVAGLMSALAYYDGYTTARLPANLLQAQRDYFGAHTYRRIDREGIFHTEWKGQ